MNRDLLKTCIEALKELQARKHHELEAGVVAELETVIVHLESCLSSDGGTVHVPTGMRVRTLGVIVECLKLVTNLSELIHSFFWPR